MENSRIVRYLETASYIVVLLAVLVTPFYIDGNSLNFFNLPKQAVFMGLTLLAFVLWAVKALVNKQVTFYQSIIDKPAILLIVVLGFSAFFSSIRSNSFLGRSDYFILSFTLLLTLVLFTWNLLQSTTSISKWQNLVNTLVIAGGLSATLFLSKALFGFNPFIGKFQGIWNTIDITNANFGVWLLIIFLLSAGQLIKKDLGQGRLMLNLFVSLVAFLGLMVLGFSTLWWMLLAGLVLLLVVGVSFMRDARFVWMSVLFVLLIADIAFLVFGGPKFIQANLPAEIALNNQPSWVIVSNNLFSGIKDFVIGSGPGTFNIIFSKFREASFNYDQNAMVMRFNYPSNSAFAILGENGLIFSLAFVFIVLLVVAHLYSSWKKTRESVVENALPEEEVINLSNHSQALETFLVSVPWLVMTGGMGFFFYTFTLWWMWWVLLGIIIVGFALFNADAIKSHLIEFDTSPEKRMSFSFVLVASIAAALAFGLWNGRFYLADRIFAKALAKGDFQSVEAEMLKALKFNDRMDIYHAAFAQVYLNEAVRLSKEEKPDMSKVSAAVGLAVNEARRATDISPNSVGLWENLTTMYENASVLVPEAQEWALKSIGRARELEPTNAVLPFRLGNTQSRAQKWEDAIKAYEEAIELKKDYVAAYAALANSYEQNKNIDKAISTFETLVQAAPANPEVLYNYGRLIYNRNKNDDRANAEKLWLAIVEKNPNFSNALYSLGLINELRGNNPVALQYYYKVKELNPENKDITEKIEKLVVKK